MTSPRRGEVWLVDLGMAAKVRPALVISIPAEDFDRALVTISRRRVPLPRGSARAIRRTGAVLTILVLTCRKSAAA